MKTTIDTIIAEVLSLPPQARAFVAEKLIESLDSEPSVTLSAAWRDEVRKRCREIDEGTVELRDAEDVFARGYAALGGEILRNSTEGSRQALSRIRSGCPQQNPNQPPLIPRN